jgi:hypothetical protein
MAVDSHFNRSLSCGGDDGLSRSHICHPLTDSSVFKLGERHCQEAFSLLTCCAIEIRMFWDGLPRPIQCASPFLQCRARNRYRTFLYLSRICVSPPSMWRCPGFPFGPVSTTLSLSTLSIDCLGSNKLPTGKENPFGHVFVESLIRRLQ